MHDCGAPKVYSTQGRLPAPRACSQWWACPPRKKTSQIQTTQGFTVNAAPELSRRGRQKGRRFSIWAVKSLWSSMTSSQSAFLVFVCLRALQGIQDLHDLLLDDLCGVASVRYQISGQREDKRTQIKVKYLSECPLRTVRNRCHICESPSIKNEELF